MRKVKVGAVQPRLIEIPERYFYLSENYRNDAAEIIEHYMKQQLAVTANLLEKAAAEGCDIVTTSEDASGLSNYSIDITEKNIFTELVELAEPIMENALSGIAKKYSMYIVGCYTKRRDGKNYNTASIFDRQGRIVGEYRKTHLPANEKWQFTPGDALDVFDLDFGRVGICICYDMMFPEVVQVQALKGAEIVFYPTFGCNWYDSIGEATLRTRANDNGVYIVTSKNYVYNSAGKSSIIDYWGQVLCDAGFNENEIVVKEIDLDSKRRQPDWYFNTQITGIDEVSVRLLQERRPELYTVITEPSREKLKIPDDSEKLEIYARIKAGDCHW